MEAAPRPPLTRRARPALRLVLALAMMGIGVGHFIAPEPFVNIVPRWLPAPAALVYVSGFFEILGGVGLLVPRVRRAASIGLVALYLSVFPANINMAVNQGEIAGAARIPSALLWARLPFQAVFIVWALWVGKRDDEAGATTKPA